MQITKSIVERLIAEQCPQFTNLKIQLVKRNGHDNRSFHLGKSMIIRLPSEQAYASQPYKENQWLNYLASRLSLAIPEPIYLGQATSYYPYPWLILKYIEGNILHYHHIESVESFAMELSNFLRELHMLDCNQGPKAGPHNFYRGGSLLIYHQETLDALNGLSQELDTKYLRKLWDIALASSYTDPDVWVHGDIAPGNLLVQDGHLCAVIDFGILGIGDPACDYAIAWTFFDTVSRQIFLAGLPQDMIDRAMGWALWKALITYHDQDEEKAKNAHYTIQEILKDY